MLSNLLQRVLANDRAFAGLLVLIFLTLGVVGVFHHAMYRDEIDVWMTMEDSASMRDVWEWMKLQGGAHPILWYGLVYLLTKVTSNPVSIQFLNLALATGVVYVVARFSPFSRLQKLLFTFGYFPLYEYGLISRCYALGFLLLVLACACFPRRTKSYLLLALILSLMANTHLYALFIASSLALACGVEFLVDRKMRESLSARKWDPIVSLAILGFSTVLAIISMKPREDVYYPWVTTFDLNRLVFALVTIVRAFVPIPVFFGKYHPDTNFVLASLPFGLAAICAVLFLAFLCSLFARKPVVLLMYAAGTLAILLFTYVVHLGSIRHQGHLFLLFVACVWLSQYYKEKPPAGRFSNVLSRGAAMFSTVFFTALLCVQAVGGIYVYCVGLRHPFSGSKAAAEFIKSHNLREMLIASDTDYSGAPISGWLRKPLYYPQRRIFARCCPTYWIKSNPMLYVTPQPQQAVQETVKMLDTNRTNALLVLNYQLQVHDKGEIVPLSSLWLSPAIQISHLAEFTDSIVDGESYYLYMISQKPGNSRIE